ncbi:hypothetical protein BSKO_13376 [Bryopsis sp. KO-2023]|nr:hypothetical protein BSKO_13376 [Bryopsis sp. KO-2023]
MSEPQNEDVPQLNGADAEDAVVAEQGAPPGTNEIPLPYAHDEEGKIIPLPGVESVFLTGTTVEIVGLQEIAEEGDDKPRATHVAKEVILNDIQFRGAISDFHPYKAAISNADYDPLLFRYNAEDIYDDGNNFEVAVTKSAADTWQFIEDEAERIRKEAEEEAARAAAEKALPRSKRKRERKPWVSLGSEVEIEEATVRPQRENVKMVLQKKRVEFNQTFKLSDKESQELWNSSQMECRPFKDPNFDLQRIELEMGVQALPVLQDSAVQATGLPLVPGSTQYLPQDLPDEKKAKLMAEPEMGEFLERVLPGYEDALIQNEIANIFEDDFSAVGEEDGAAGGRKENVITEHQSFTDLTYSKGKGVVAVSCTEPYSHQERIERAGRPTNATILVWNFKDPIHPEYAFESPFEVSSFQYNPVNPDIVAAGCFNGQIITWDTSTEVERLGRAKDVKREDGSDEASIPVIKHKHMSAVEFSHTTMVTDIHWAKGIDVTKNGQMTKVADGVLGKECFFFATTATDGKVMFWDIRVERSMKKGQKGDSATGLQWRPIYTVALIGCEGGDLASLQFSFSLQDAFKTEFFASSFDGEVAYADWVRPEDEEHPEHTKSITMSHCGPVKSLQRSPFFDGVLLSVGDWTFQIWREGHDKPLFVSPYAQQYYITACWSPTRPGVLYLSMQGGILEVWDLLDRTHEPSMSTTLTSSPIMSLAFNTLPAGHNSASQQLLAMGDSAGVLHIMELPRNLRRALHNEKKLVDNFLTQEMSRLEDAADREGLRQETLKARQEEEKQAEGDENKDKENANANKTAAVGEYTEKEEEEYKKLEHELKVHLGLEEEPKA